MLSIQLTTLLLLTFCILSLNAADRCPRKNCVSSDKQCLNEEVDKDRKCAKDDMVCCVKKNMKNRRGKQKSLAVNDNDGQKVKKSKKKQAETPQNQKNKSKGNGKETSEGGNSNSNIGKKQIKKKPRKQGQAINGGPKDKKSEKDTNKKPKDGKPGNRSNKKRKDKKENSKPKKKIRNRGKKNKKDKKPKTKSGKKTKKGSKKKDKEPNTESGNKKGKGSRNLPSEDTVNSCYRCKTWDTGEIGAKYDPKCGSTPYSSHKDDAEDTESFTGCAIKVYDNGDVLRLFQSEEISDDHDTSNAGDCYWGSDLKNDDDPAYKYTRCWCEGDNCNTGLCEDCARTAEDEKKNE
ncbi:unnamed protein product [Meganyctiphanes norvegica]|uniref:Uncharacterized protein n=1 Tax=Meganyctiphanes norvegica TaxID=48144 RepID=A0AAV2PS31_MEGNR